MPAPDADSAAEQNKNSCIEISTPDVGTHLLDDVRRACCGRRTEPREQSYMAAVFSLWPQRTAAKVLQKQNTWKSGCTAFMKKTKSHASLPAASLAALRPTRHTVFLFVQEKKQKKPGVLRGPLRSQHDYKPQRLCRPQAVRI
jgi:hypothetical protein